MGCEFVYPGCWQFEKVDDKIDDVLIEHDVIPHVLPLAVQLRISWWLSRGDHLKMFLLVVCKKEPTVLTSRSNIQI